METPVAHDNLPKLSGQNEQSWVTVQNVMARSWISMSRNKKSSDVYHNLHFMDSFSKTGILSMMFPLLDELHQFLGGLSIGGTMVWICQSGVMFKMVAHFSEVSVFWITWEGHRNCQSHCLQHFLHTIQPAALLVLDGQWLLSSSDSFCDSPWFVACGFGRDNCHFFHCIANIDPLWWCCWYVLGNHCLQFLLEQKNNGRLITIVREHS